MKKIIIGVIVLLLLIILFATLNQQYLLIRYHIWRLGGADVLPEEFYKRFYDGEHEAGRPTIFAQVADKDFRQRNADALVKIGLPAIPYIKEVIISNNYRPIQKIAAIYVLRELGTSILKQNIDVLITTALSDKEPIVRFNAICALGEIEDKKIIPILIGKLEDKEIGAAEYPGLDSICRCFTIRGEALHTLRWIIRDSKIRLIDTGTINSPEKWIEIKQTLTAWWEENKNYLYIFRQKNLWGNDEWGFAIDQEAKAAGGYSITTIEKMVFYLERYYATGLIKDYEVHFSLNATLVDVQNYINLKDYQSAIILLQHFSHELKTLTDESIDPDARASLLNLAKLLTDQELK